MEKKTGVLFAAITATALLGSAIGVNAFVLTKDTKNNFGLKGTYSLAAFAEDKAEASTYIVDGVAIDTTTTLVLESTDEAKYTLFVTPVDMAEMYELKNIQVGYTIGGTKYSGISEGLSTTVYKSFSVKTIYNTISEPITAADLSKKFEKITKPMFVIAEVETSKVWGTGYTLTITANKA